MDDLSDKKVIERKGKGHKTYYILARQEANVNHQGLNLVFGHNEKRRMTNKQYCEGFNVSRQTATRDLQELVGKNQIAETGKGRGVKYIVKGND